jgi:hypothetical protein
MSNAGRNHAPLSQRNVTPEEAQATMDRYNAESTYNTYSNNKAFDHLKDLHQTMSMLAPHMEGHADFGQAKEAVSGAIQQHLEHNVGDLLSGQREPNGALTYGTGSRAYVGAAQHILSGINHPDAGVSMLLHQAQEHASNFQKAYTPAYLDTNAKNKKTTGETGVSVVVDPEYRKNIFDYPRKTESNPADQKAADKDWSDALKQTADGRYRKSAQYEQNKKDKGYKKPVKPKPQGE